MRVPLSLCGPLKSPSNHVVYVCRGCGRWLPLDAFQLIHVTRGACEGSTFGMWKQILNYPKGWRGARDLFDIREVASLRSLYDQSLEVTDIWLTRERIFPFVFFARSNIARSLSDSKFESSGWLECSTARPRCLQHGENFMPNTEWGKIA